MMGGDEKSLREIKGHVCWERRAKREEITGILPKARIIIGRVKARNRKIG